MQPLHEFIKACRMERGLSVDEVATAMDISRSLIYQYEGNKIFPNGKNLIKLARFYHFSLDTLFDICHDTKAGPPIYNKLGENIYFEPLAPQKNTSYYVLSSSKAVLVKQEKHFKKGQQVLAFYQEKATIFTILHDQQNFYLLHSDGQLFLFGTPEIQIIGTVLQWIIF